MSQIPIPTWIHTAAAAAWTGWYDQVVPPQFTTCCTHPGELAASGAITCDGRPAAMAGCACNIPSKIHNRPNPSRSSRRPAGSAAHAAARLAVPRDGASLPLAATHTALTRPKISNARIAWWISAARNAATTTGSLASSPEFMPGIALPPAALARPGCQAPERT